MDNELRFRQIHLDFHTSGYIAGIGSRFDPEEFAATLREVGEDFQREDFCIACWEARGEQGAVAVWRTHVPKAQEKKILGKLTLRASYI